MGPDPNNTMRLGTDIRYAMNFPGRERRPAHRHHHAARHRLPRGSQPARAPYDYPFSLFEMRFDKSGKGEGRMAYATQIMFDKKNNSIEIENYSSEPVRLNNLELEVRK